MNMVCIVIINWNGYQDTIECLQSLNAMDYEDYFVVVGDNGSENHSLEEIENFLNKENLEYLRTEFGNEKSGFQIKKRFVVLYDLKENHGFSKGNNLVLAYASLYSPNYYLLLNNDTVVEPNFLHKLVCFQREHDEFKLLTPLIRYYYKKNIVWNAGGNIYWGFRKYHYADQFANRVKEDHYILCSFITGCALFFVPSLLDKSGHIFTEKFFFGEEDFELGLRMKQQKQKMACLVDAVIYHKVGMSRKRDSSKLGHAYIYYLNRLMDVRDYMSPIAFSFYSWIFYVNIIIKLRILYSLKWNNIWTFIKKLKEDLRKRNNVSKEYCLSLFSNKNILFEN